MDEYPDTYVDDYPQEGSSRLHDYLWLIRKRLWLILAISTIVVFTVYVKQLRMEPVYRATARVLIERYNPQVVKVTEVFAPDAYTSDYYPTQHRILESPAIAEEVIKTLKLDEHPEFNREPESSWFPINIRGAVASVVRAVIQGKQPREGSPSSRESFDPLAPYIGLYLARLRIEPIPDSRLVKISVEGHDPVLAAQMANAHAQAYIDKNLEMKLSASEDAVDWLSDRLGELKARLQESEESLQRFQEDEDIVALETLLTSSGGSEESLVAQKLAELNEDLTAARTECIGLETLHRQLRDLSNKPGNIESIPQVIENAFIQNLKGNYSELNREYSELREKYGERHPRMVALREEMRGVRSRIAAEVQKIAKSVEIQYKVAAAKEQGLVSALKRVKEEVVKLNRKAIEYGVLKREVESNRQLYDAILKRTKETSLTSGLKSTNIYIVDRAKVPGAPFKPQVRRQVMMAAILSLMLGVGLVFFLDYMDNTIHSPKEVEKYLNVPFLGSVGIANIRGRAASSELVALYEPRSNLAESLRSVRTNVVFSLTEPGQKTLLITSPRPQEGKTLISSNLAAIMARLGRRVLLIDADMRKPRAHTLFNTHTKPGLSNLVLGKCTEAQAIRDTRLQLLKVLPAGQIPPNPSEILGSRLMQRLLARLEERFDFIIIDTPPVLSATDATVLGAMIDGVVLVVKASETTREGAQLALRHLKDVDARLLGVVLNQVDFRKERFYYNNYYKYYDYYKAEGEDGHYSRPTQRRRRRAYHRGRAPRRLRRWERGQAG